MKNKSNILFRLMIGLMVLGLLGLNLLAVAQASPPAQDPRPPADTGGGGGGGGGGVGTPGDGIGNASTESGPAGLGCAATTGQVINWGFGPQGDIGVELKTGSWRTSTLSASDGNYGLGGLGVGIARLHVSVAPAQAKQLQPLIQDAGVYLNCKYPTIANIAVYSGSRIDPPAAIDMSAPSQAITPDSNFEVTLTVKNSLPDEITNVIVTDMMPRGFKVLKVTSSLDPRDARIIDGGEDGQLVVVNLDKLAAKASVTIGLTINADVDLLGGTKIRNVATLFYRESAADQAWLDFTVGSDETPELAASAGAGTGADFVPPSEAPTTGGSLTEDAGDQAEAVSPARESAPTIRPAAAGDDFVPPSNMPSTGGEIDLPMDTLDPTGQVNFSEAKLITGREVNGINDTSLTTTDNSVETQVEVVYKAASTGPSITVAIALLFLGLLVLGSGITLWHRRSDSL